MSKKTHKYRNGIIFKWKIFIKLIKKIMINSNFIKLSLIKTLK